MRRTILMFFSLPAFFLSPCAGQDPGPAADAGRPLRVEIPVKSAGETYRVVAGGEEGLVVFFRSQEITDDGKTNWYFAGYDTNLVQRWVQPVPLTTGREWRFDRYRNDTLSLLFSNSGKPRTGGSGVDILRLSLSSGTLILNTVPLENGEMASHFGLSGNRAWLGITGKGDAGRMMTVNLDKGNRTVFPLGEGDRTGILWMEPDTAAPGIMAVVTRQVSKKSVEFFFVAYDTSGKIIRESSIPAGTGGQRLIRVDVAGSAPGEWLLLGTYGHEGRGSGGKGYGGPLSAGFFSCLIRNGTAQPPRYHNFLDFSNASSFVGENGLMYLKKKALRKNRSLEEYSLDYAMLIHPVFKNGGRFVLMAESYTPQYHTESFTDFDFYGRPYTNSYSVFDGYRFYNAIVAGFDPEGGRAWDNCMEIRNLVSFDPGPKVTAYPSGQDLVLCYSSEGKIGSRIIRGSDVVDKLDYADLDLMDSGDKLIGESKGLLMHWYGPFFLSQGYQEIRNISMESNNKRMVFCFSKLRFDP